MEHELIKKIKTSRSESSAAKNVNTIKSINLFFTKVFFTKKIILF